KIVVAAKTCKVAPAKNTAKTALFLRKRLIVATVLRRRSDRTMVHCGHFRQENRTLSMQIIHSFIHNLFTYGRLGSELAVLNRRPSIWKRGGGPMTIAGAHGSSLRPAARQNTGTAVQIIGAEASLFSALNPEKC